ncbi:MAG: polysaccharide biosynthesis protein [Phycisphaerae bacterium SM23_33]|jgi:perosamine synthetase|nr:MAG: polysaccharide biosynthesis protein [Phycisphaerae bacterium SM23_33]
MSDTVEQVPLSAPDIAEAERDAVLSVLRTPRLSIGPRTEAFEAAVAARTGRTHGVAVNSGTSGLHLCVRGLGIGEGDEVITTPFSFVATTNCVLFERARPVFVDIDPESYNMDPAGIEAAITPRTKAILPVEVFGNMAHFEQYERIARKHKLLLIEDCCEALGGAMNGRPAGGFGACGVFGFYPNKQITTGEGGLIVTDDDRLADLCRSMRNQGRNTQVWLSHARLGYNYRMSEIAAALGQAQMRRLDEILARRRAAAALYQKALGDVHQIHLPPMSEPPHASWFVYVIRLTDEFTQQQRDAIMAQMRAGGVQCAPYFVPIHLQPYIMDLLGTRAGDFPVTERVAARTLALPFFANLAPGQVERVKAELTASIRRQARAAKGR